MVSYGETYGKQQSGIGERLSVSSVISEGFGRLHGPRPLPAGTAALSLLTSGKYVIDPELRGAEFERITQNLDMQFWKSFWNVTESNILSVGGAARSSSRSVARGAPLKYSLRRMFFCPGLQPDRLQPGAGELHADRAAGRSAPPAGLGPQPADHRVATHRPLGPRPGPHETGLLRASRRSGEGPEVRHRKRTQPGGRKTRKHSGVKTAAL